MNRAPKHEPPMDAPAKTPPPAAPTQPPFVLPCDRPCMSLRGILIHPGTEVTYLRRDAGRDSLYVQMSDGSREVVSGQCFARWRALEEFRRRILRLTPDTPHLEVIRAAVMELPDRAGLAKVPPDIRSFLVVQLSQIMA